MQWDEGNIVCLPPQGVGWWVGCAGLPSRACPALPWLREHRCRLCRSAVGPGWVWRPHLAWLPTEEGPGSQLARLQSLEGYGPSDPLPFPSRREAGVPLVGRPSAGSLLSGRAALFRGRRNRKRKSPRGKRWCGWRGKTGWRGTGAAHPGAWPPAAARPSPAGPCRAAR